MTQAGTRPRATTMNKARNALAWILVLVGQLAVSYGLITLTNLGFFQSKITSIPQFLPIPFSIWGSYVLGVFGMGMIGLTLMKATPPVVGLRFFTTAVLTAIPMWMLTVNAVTVGVNDLSQFQSIVIARMVPYYTELAAVFALLGFFVTVWWQRATPKKPSR